MAVMSLTRAPQGGLRPLDSEPAHRLLKSAELARLACVAHDGTPRVFPMLFPWGSEEAAFSALARTKKIAALRARPDVAVTIDTAGTPLEVLLVRGRAEVSDVDGITPEYVLAQHRHAGPEQGARNVAEVDRPGMRMARTAIRSRWVGMLDFTTRFPGGVGAEAFERRGE